jgi:hypothetical protein
MAISDLIMAILLFGQFGFQMSAAPLGGTCIFGE